MNSLKENKIGRYFDPFKFDKIETERIPLPMSEKPRHEFVDLSENTNSVKILPQELVETKSAIVPLPDENKKRIVIIVLKVWMRKNAIAMMNI